MNFNVRSFIYVSMKFGTISYPVTYMLSHKNNKFVSGENSVNIRDSISVVLLTFFKNYLH